MKTEKNANIISDNQSTVVLPMDLSVVMAFPGHAHFFFGKVRLDFQCTHVKKSRLVCLTGKSYWQCTSCRYDVL